MYTFGALVLRMRALEVEATGGDAQHIHFKARISLVICLILSRKLEDLWTPRLVQPDRVCEFCVLTVVVLWGFLSLFGVLTTF